MSSNQSRLDRTESQQYRNSGRSNRNYRGGGGSKASGTGSGGGATAAAPSSVNSNSSSTNNPALTSNRSFKKHKNVQGGQQPRGGAASGVHVNSNSGTGQRPLQNGADLQRPSLGTSDEPVRNTAVNPAAVKPSDVASPNDSRAPRAPPSNVSAANNDSKPPTTLVAPAKAPADASFSLQFGFISPGYMNGMQVPPRTTSGPPNLDEQKREQMRHDSHRTQPTVHPTPAQSIPKQLAPKKDVGMIDQSVTADVQPILKPKREAQVTASARISQPQKQPVHSIPGMPMQMPFHQQQVPVQFGGPNPQIQAQAMSSSLPMSMLVPLQNHALPHQMFVPGLQPHPVQSQGLLHQGQNLPFTSHLGPQLPPQLGNVGMNMPPQFPQQQAAKYGLARKAVKITHPDIHEELRLDGSPAARSHSNVPQSHPISSFPAAHTMNYYPTPGTYNAGPIFFPPTTSLPLNNSQPPTSQPARLYSQVTGKPATGSNVEKDLASLSADVKEKSSQELHVVKSPAPPKGRKKKKDLFKKIEINASSDLYKGPAEKKEVANPAEVSDTISSSVDQAPSHAPSHSEVSNENAVQSKVTVKPATGSNVEKDPASLSADVKEKSSQELHVVKSPAPPKGRKKKKDLFKKIEINASSDLYKGPAEKKEVANPAEVSDTISSSVDQVPSHAPSHSEVSNENAVQSKVEPEDWEDAAEIPTPKLEASQSGNQVLGSGEDAIGVAKKYSRDFLLIFAEQCTALPEGVEFAPYIAEALMATNANFSHESYSNTATGRNIDWPKEGLHVVKSPAPPKGRKKKKDLFKKIEINASSDLYKGPAEKKEVANPAEVSDTISSSVDQVPSHAPSHSEVSNENAVQSKVEPEDWEDAAEISTPKLEASQSGNQVLGNGEDAIGVAKKYSRDFLLIFAEQCTALPEGVEFAPYIAEALMATNINFSHESYSNTATGRNIDWPKEGLHVVKSPAPPKGRKKKKDLFKKIEINASSDLYKGPAEKKEVANPAEVSDTISSSVDQVPSHAPSHSEVSNENAVQSKVEPEDWEDAAEIPTPKLEASQSGNQVLGSGEDAIGVAKKYSRDFLLIFAEQCTALPEGVEFAPYIAEALMATNINFSHESYSNTATGRNIDWPKEGLHVVKSPAPPKGRKKKKDLFKKIEINASSDLYKGSAEKKEVANPAEVSDTISSSVDQVPSHAPSHCEVSNENAVQSKVEPEDWEDAQSLIDRFKLLQSQDPDFFYTFQLDDDGHLCNLFWRDGISKLYYECYGDVVTFDTTYRTNKYNLICAPFVGVNNHRKNVYFGCAFMGDETTKSFQWLFQTFLDAMGGKPPVTFFTDQDEAMAKAIKTTMPSTRHRLCEWHIEKNAAQRIPHLFGKPEFRDKYFNKLLWKCESEVEFHSLWKGMTEKWNTKDNSWLNKLFDLKEKWSLAFNRDVFSADIKSTQRSESTNRVFNDFSCRTLTLVEFVTRYEEGVKIMRIKEARHDFISRGKPKSVLDGIGILDHAGCVFTFSIFKKFQAEFLEATKLKILSMSNVGNRMEFVLQLGDERHSYKVQYCAVDETISCSCHMFETKGWLCSHALRILHFNVGLSQIPCSYILKRWTKAAKQGVAFQDYAQKNGSTFSSSITVRHSNLTRKAVAIMSLAASDEHTEAIANRYLDLARAEIIEYQNRIVDVDQCEETVPDTEDTGSVQEVVVFDPFNRRRKGAPNLRMKSAIEKNRKKSTAKITKKQVDENDMISTDSEGALEQYFNGNAWWI